MNTSIKLDVGCYSYLCPIELFKKYPDCVLAKSIEFDQQNSTESSDSIRINSDGKCFGLILKYLKDENSLNLRGLKEKQLSRLSVEADYFGLEELQQKCLHRIHNFERWRDFKLHIPILTNDENLKNIEIPALVLDFGLINDLEYLEMIPQMPILFDFCSCDVMGYPSGNSRLRLFKPGELKPILESRFEFSYPSKKARLNYFRPWLCDFLLQVDKYFLGKKA